MIKNSIADYRLVEGGHPVKTDGRDAQPLGRQLLIAL